VLLFTGKGAKVVVSHIDKMRAPLVVDKIQSLGVLVG